MAGALAERQMAEPYRQERERRSLRVVERESRRRRGLDMRRRPGVWLVAFAICVALLAVGRVTLSFAVVQKNMDTEVLVREQRALSTENAHLQDRLAGLMATPRLRELGIERFGLVPAQNVIYLEGTVAGDRSAAGAKSQAGVVDDGGR